MQRFAASAAAVVLAFAAAGFAPCVAASPCLGPALAEVPLLDAGDRSAVPVSLDGQPYALIVDTGATHVALASSAVARLGLGVNWLRSPVFAGIGGLGSRGLVDLRELRLGGLKLTDANIPVISLPLPSAGDLPVAGVLGASVLSRFDVDLDFAGRRLSLHVSAGCAPVSPPWGGVWSRLPLETEPSNLDGLIHHDDVMTVGTEFTVYRGLPHPDHARLFTVVQVNSRPMLAIVDTGASVSALTPEAAVRAGIGQEGAPLAMVGVDEHPVLGRLVVARVSIGADERGGVTLGVAEMDIGRADMILGHDLMAGRRVLLAYETKQMLWQRADR